MSRTFRASPSVPGSLTHGHADYIRCRRERESDFGWFPKPAEGLFLKMRRAEGFFRVCRGTGLLRRWRGRSTAGPPLMPTVPKTAFPASKRRFPTVAGVTNCPEVVLVCVRETRRTNSGADYPTITPLEEQTWHFWAGNVPSPARMATRALDHLALGGRTQHTIGFQMTLVSFAASRDSAHARVVRP